MGSTSGTNKISIFIQMIFSSFLDDVLVTVVYRRHNDKNVFSVHREHQYQLLIRLGSRTGRQRAGTNADRRPLTAVVPRGNF